MRPSAEARRARLRASEGRGERDPSERIPLSDGADGLAWRVGGREALGGTPTGSIMRPEPWEYAKDAEDTEDAEDTATAADGGGNKPAT